jgi:hypothetical protein
MKNTIKIFLKDSISEKQERRRYPREMLTADNKRTSYKSYVAASGTYFRNYYCLGDLSMKHLELDR